ncbi:hypothetical protein K1X76_05360 [bacterium]|nr:hypothetical protein [bacterium]
MEKTLKVINQLQQKGIIDQYALGGAMALLFYAEPTLTFDLDIFIFLPDQKNKALLDMSSLYAELKQKGYPPKNEHVYIEGIPVQFIPAYNPLVEEALKNADTKKYKLVKTKVLKIEYLLAIMIDTNRPKDRERIKTLLETVKFDNKLLKKILDKFNLKTRWNKEIEK